MNNKVNLDIEYTPGDATRTQMLKEAGLTWEDYAKAMLSLEEFIKLFKEYENRVGERTREIDIKIIKSESCRLDHHISYPDECCAHATIQNILLSLYPGEEQTNLTDTPVMCKCGDMRKDHYDNWGEYTGCGNKLNCGCSKFVSTN